MSCHQKWKINTALLASAIVVAFIVSSFPNPARALAISTHQATTAITVEQQRDLGLLNPLFAEPDLYENSMVWVGDEPASLMQNPNRLGIADT